MNTLKGIFLAAAVTVGGLSVPVAAYEGRSELPVHASAHAAQEWQYGDRDHRWRDRRDRDYRDRDRDRYYGRSYDEPVYRNTRTWRGRDGQYYCQKKDGTTGLIIGGAVGALLGREIDSRGDRTLGTLLGAAGGALLGKEVAQGQQRCR